MNATLAALGWADLAATIVLVGGLFSAALIAPPSEAGRRWWWRAAAALAVVLPAEFAVTAFRMYEVSGLHGTTLVVDLARTRWGMLGSGRAAGLALLAAGGQLPPGPLAALGAGWLLLRSFQGHAGAHGTLSALIDWLHLLAAAAWLGGLVQLALLPRPVPVEIATRVRVQATTALAVLVPAGIYAAFLHVRHLDLLVGSPYGETLIAKLALASVLLALGAANHFGHVPAMRRGAPRAEGKLVRAVRLEVVAGAVVLALTALLGVLPMPHGHAP